MVLGHVANDFYGSCRDEVEGKTMHDLLGTLSALYLRKRCLGAFNLKAVHVRSNVLYVYGQL